MGHIILEKIAVFFDGVPIITDLSMEIENGELFSLLGPSGVGKTTILKAIAGLIKPASGKIFFDGKRVDHLQAEEREAVLVFQRPLLFPFLNVEENIGFGLKMAKLDRRSASKKIDRIVAITGLAGLEKRKIHQLSGGQQQRVALARGLVLEPSVLLLDEPLSNLDQELRLQMRQLIKEIQLQTATTMLFVTHDQGEALALSNRISLLIDGVIQQTGSPAELFYQPANSMVARFFGCTNFFHGKIESGYFISDPLQLPTNGEDCLHIMAAVRPEHIDISYNQKDDALPGIIVEKHFEGSTTWLRIEVGREFIEVITLEAGFAVDQEVWLKIQPQHLLLFPGNYDTI